MRNKHLTQYKIDILIKNKALMKHPINACLIEIVYIGNLVYYLLFAHFTQVYKMCQVVSYT